MPLLRKPSLRFLQKFLAEQAELEFTYETVGATAGTPPLGYVVDHTRVKLGEGIDVFNAAKMAIQCWRQFQIGWIEVYPTDTPIRKDQVVGIAVRSVGLWWLNSCRIVYVIDEQDQDQQSRFGFAYGTLPGHSGRGEERFLVEMDSGGQVWYDILAFSRPHRLLFWIGYPHLRHVQRMFGRHSAALMYEMVQPGRLTLDAASL